VTLNGSLDALNKSGARSFPSCSENIDAGLCLPYMAVREVCPIILNLETAHLSFADPKKGLFISLYFLLKTSSSRFIIALIVDNFSDSEDIPNLRSNFGILLIFRTSL
jgi:hypothetical protein